MESLDIPEFTPAGKSARAVFLEDWNDVDVYIEDKDPATQKVYVNLFNRCFFGRYKILRVLPLGGRSAVIGACSRDQSDGGRKRVYLVDGDMNAVISDEEPNLKRLCILPFYCIENILIDHNAALRILDEETADETAESLKTKLDFPAWIASICEGILGLVVEHHIAFKSDLGIPCVPCSRVVSSPDGYIDQGKVDAAASAIRAEIIVAIGEEGYKKNKQNISNIIEKKYGGKTNRIISGKNYLLPLMSKRIVYICGRSIPFDVMKIRLSGHCDVADLQFIERAWAA